MTFETSHSYFLKHAGILEDCLRGHVKVQALMELVSGPIASCLQVRCFWGALYTKSIRKSLGLRRLSDRKQKKIYRRYFTVATKTAE